MRSVQVRAKMTRHRECMAFAELSHAHWVILENAKAQREGWFYECLTANILGAFKVEAYFNHIGALLFPDWAQRERRLSKGKKLDRILSRLQIKKGDTDQRYRTLETLFRFRDAVAHARAQRLVHRESIETGEVEELRRRKPLTDWEKLCTLEFATRAYDDTESLISGIHKAAGFDEADLSFSGHSYEIKVLESLNDDVPSDDTVAP